MHSSGWNSLPRGKCRAQANSKRCSREVRICLDRVLSSGACVDRVSSNGGVQIRGENTSHFLWAIERDIRNDYAIREIEGGGVIERRTDDRRGQCSIDSIRYFHHHAVHQIGCTLDGPIVEERCAGELRRKRI